MNLSMHLRKACNHPYLLSEDQAGSDADPEELVRSSGKLELLDRVLPKLHKTGHRVLLFSQMTRALDLVQVRAGEGGDEESRSATGVCLWYVPGWQ